MLNHLLKEKGYHLILGSGSPRRHAFLKAMHLDFEIRVKPVEEVYSKSLKEEEITNYLAKLKAEAFKDELKPKDILITSDTIVWFKDAPIEKPKDAEDAYRMLSKLSGNTHLVVSSVCFTTTQHQQLLHCISEVTFKIFTQEELHFYINTYKPFDKAGAYGIQDWIGTVGITHIKGSYNNVVGMPTHLVYNTLEDIILNHK